MRCPSISARGSGLVIKSAGLRVPKTLCRRTCFALTRSCTHNCATARWRILPIPHLRQMPMAALLSACTSGCSSTPRSRPTLWRPSASLKPRTTAPNSASPELRVISAVCWPNASANGFPAAQHPQTYYAAWPRIRQSPTPYRHSGPADAATGNRTLPGQLLPGSAQHATTRLNRPRVAQTFAGTIILWPAKCLADRARGNLHAQQRT